MGTLERILRAAHGRAVVAELTRDPDPAPDHDYDRSPQSGAGNCRCGAAEHHRRHLHEFLATASGLCVCGLPAGAKVHERRAAGASTKGDES